jgi:hypothetical protein
LSNRHTLAELRLNPTEWHRRGMSAPTDIDKLVSARLGYRYTSETAEPSYADFFVTA